MSKVSREYELWEKCSPGQKEKCCEWGPHTSYQLCNSPRHILFALSRCKFAAKMIGEDKKILELGCGDGFGSVILAEFAYEYLGVDFDKEMISWAQRHLTTPKRKYLEDNFLGKQYGSFDAVVSLDVIEHVYPENEGLFFSTITNNLTHNGIAIIGTPNVAAQRFSKQNITEAHVNLYDAERLKDGMLKFFNNVFIFSVNDEVIHTGYYPLAHIYLAMGCYKK